MRTKISDTLIEMGLDPTLKGYTCIVEALMYMHENDVDLTKIRTHFLYENVANRLGVEPKTVKASIGYANSKIIRTNPLTKQILGEVRKPTKYTLQLLYLRIR